MKASLPSSALPTPPQMFKVAVPYSVMPCTMALSKSQRLVVKDKEKEGNCSRIEKAEEAWEKTISLPTRWEVERMLFLDIQEAVTLPSRMGTCLSHLVILGQLQVPVCLSSVFLFIIRSQIPLAASHSLNSQGWPWTLNLLPLPPERWDYRHVVPPCPASYVCFIWGNVRLAESWKAVQFPCMYPLPRFP